MNLKKGSKYRVKVSSEKLIFLGCNFCGNGYWYQFALEEKPDEVWAEMWGSDLFLIEEIPVKGDS